MKPGDWTAQHQVTAEVAIACGVSFGAIAQMLGVSHRTVRCHILVESAERNRLRARQWWKDNLARARQSMRRRLDRNPRYLQQWREANRALVRESLRRREAIKRAGRRHAPVPLTLGTRLERFALWGGGCAYCGAPDADTVDHVLALNRGGLDTPPNVAPACVPCNSSKCNAPVEDWYRRQAFFSEERWQKLQEHCPDMLQCY